ncbi:hypothetical protein [Spirosoma pulveris]
MPFSPQALLTILETKDGIFEKKELSPEQNVIPLSSLEEAFEREKTRIRNFSRRDVAESQTIDNGQIAKIRDISFDLNPIPIDTFKDNLIELQNESPALTHLAIYYGLTPAQEMILIMQGVQLDGSEGGTKLDKKPLLATRSQFTSANLSMTTTSCQGARQLFKSIFGFIHGRGKFIWGAYMRINVLLAILAELKEEGCMNVQTTLAYLEPAPEPTTGNQADLKCFHLVFRGVKPDGLTKSAKVYSTYDQVEGYSGPKPSCPPFGETAQ